MTVNYLYNIISWEPEGHYCSSKMFRWEPEGRYCCTKSMAIAPFWFSTEHLWAAITPFWLSADDMNSHIALKEFYFVLNYVNILSQVMALLFFSWKMCSSVYHGLYIFRPSFMRTTCCVIICVSVCLSVSLLNYWNPLLIDIVLSCQ